jgi:hypothetical protein
MHLQTYSLTKAAAILEIHRNTLASWIDRGCPAVEEADRSNGKEWQISIPAVIDWRIHTAVADAVAAFRTDEGFVSKDEADRRKALAQARLAEIDVDERERTVVLTSDATANMTDFCMALRSGVDNGVAKTAGRAAMMTDPNEIREFLMAEFNKSWRAAQTELNEKWSELRDGESADPDADRADTDNEEQIDTFE